ncbi:MAG: hypothetical protein Q9225_003410 [Loekoesia sp. 1 TL-2023]
MSTPQVSSKSSLRSLLLVSRKVYRAVLPSLYRSISFVIDSSIGTYQANYKLLRMADKENPGLLHIQDIKLSLEDELTRQQHHVADYPDAIQLLEAIPRDILSQFRWNSWHSIPTEVLRLLWSRQRKLTNVELITSAENLDKLAAAVGVSKNQGKEYTFHQHATSLRITDVGQGTIPLIALQLLQCRPKIDTLTLDFWAVRLHLEHGHHDDFHKNLANAYNKGLLLKEIFAPPSYLRPPHRLALKELHLHAVDLRRSCRLLLTALDTTVLKVLEVVSCFRPDDLFTRMSKLSPDARPRLERLEIFYEQNSPEPTWVSDENHTDYTTKAINDLLLSMENTLSTIWIVMRGLFGHDRLLGPLASGIERHGKSLVRLTIDIRTPNFYITCLSHLVDKITDLRSQLITDPRRNLEIIGFGLHERNHFMRELHLGLRPAYFVKSKTVTLGREQMVMRYSLVRKIQKSDSAGLISEVKDIDRLAKRRRRTNAHETHP